MVKKVISNNQSGGITAGVINMTNTKNNKKKYSIIAVIMLILAIFTFLGLTGDKMFWKDKIPSEVYDVESNNQTGGITAGKIENINIIADKESLGIREPDGLYQNGKKVGVVYDFNVDESSKTFTIFEIEFDKSLRDPNSVWQPYEYEDYIIQIKNINTLVTMMPPGAKIVNGIILGRIS